MEKFRQSFIHLQNVLCGIRHSDLSKTEEESIFFACVADVLIFCIERIKNGFDECAGRMQRSLLHSCF